MKRIFFAAAALSAFAFTGCLDMEMPSKSELLEMRDYKEGCPAGYGPLIDTLTACPPDETCSTLDDGTICVKYHVDTTGGDGINCDAGWITVSDSEFKNCEVLTGDEEQDVSEMPKLTDKYYCKSGRVTNRYCRYVPADTTDSRVNVIEGQRCTAEQSEPANDTLRIHVIDVGNGDAIWIQTPTGQNILIDAGDSAAFGVTAGGPIITDYLQFHGFEKGSMFDAVFLTHPHSDHFGGLATVFNSYKLKNYIDPMERETSEDVPSTYVSWIKKMSGMVEDGHIYMPAEDTLSTSESMPAEFFGPDVKAEYIFSRKQFVSANGDNKNNNTASIIFRLTYGGISMLFTGDATDVDEAAAVSVRKDKLKSNFLKVCHHGSETSSSPTFLHAIWDDVNELNRGAFISSGRKSFSGTYIPSPVTLNRLVNEGYVKINQLFSTSVGDDAKVESETYRDDNILIVVKSDGSYYSCYSGTN